MSGASSASKFSCQVVATSSVLSLKIVDSSVGCVDDEKSGISVATFVLVDAVSVAVLAFELSWKR